MVLIVYWGHWTVKLHSFEQNYDPVPQGLRKPCMLDVSRNLPLPYLSVPFRSAVLRLKWCPAVVLYLLEPQGVFTLLPLRIHSPAPL